jgi:hypothetical protein
MVGDPVLPNLPFEIKVARQHAELALKLVAEAQKAGPAAAEAAEKEFECERGLLPQKECGESVD